MRRSRTARVLSRRVAGPSISTHVLDTRLGRPAAGVPVSLYRLEGGQALLQSTAQTGDDGRIGDLANGERLAPGQYRVSFDVGWYFRQQGVEKALFSRVLLDIQMAEEGHYHVPLLISPHACVSYRGS